MTGMNFELSAEGQKVLQEFQQLRKEKVAPRALTHDRAATFAGEAVLSTVRGHRVKRKGAATSRVTEI